MPRTLTISRVSVRPGREPEYLEAVRQLARLAEARGWHLWIFRHPDQAGTYLEFSESKSRESHRSVVARPADEAELEAKIRAVAEYQPGAWELWEEVR